MVYGGTPPVELVHEKVPDVATGSKQSLKGCLLGYVALGWSGYVPAACRKGLMFVPLNIAPWSWGWPDEFLTRMRDNGVQVLILGPHGGGEFSTGIDEVEQLSELPKGFDGGIWTNRIERIGPAARARTR
jgi:glycerophosphoryl diester phosphodiesterase